MRLQKFISNNSNYSRRYAEKLIKAGKVTVNNEIITIPYYEVKEDDIVFVNGRLIKRNKTLKYLVFHKPAEVLSSFKPEEGKVCLKKFIDTKYNLKPAGRLDFLTEGLLILSNDGDFINIITHPRYEIEKEYLLFSYQEIKEEFLAGFKEGIFIEGVFYKAKRIEKIKTDVVKFVLNEGKNREIRVVAKAYEQPIARLVRVRIGIVKMENLKKGRFRELKKDEIEYFYKIKRKVDLINSKFEGNR